MRNKNLLLFLSLSYCLILSISLQAQPDWVSATMHANNVKVTVNSNGSLFWDFQEGQFIAPYDDNAPEISTMRASGLWLSGIDGAGHLRGAIQLYNEDQKTDFVPGILEGDIDQVQTREFNKIWRVTKTDIEAHRADYADNGVIDNPLPSIFGWPARKNAFFANYNDGIELPTSDLGSLGPFWDLDANGNYNPDKGDYPLLIIRDCPVLDIEIPKEMLWFSFHDRTNHTQSGLLALNIEVQCTVFAYECEAAENPINNSVFVDYKIINNGSTPLDSTYVGFFNDFDLGNPTDDFFGVDQSRHLVYAYNGDSVDEGFFEENIPTMGIDVLRGPLNEMGEEQGMGFVQPFDADQTVVGAEFYRLLTGSKTDGTPADYNGVYYPDNPNDPNGTSEISLGNIPGDRATISSFGPFLYQPGAVNQVLVAYTFHQDANNSVLENVDAFIDQSDQVQAFFDNCMTNTTCDFLLPTEELFGAYTSIYPNPTMDELIIEVEVPILQSLRVIDLQGKVLQRYNWSTPIEQFNLSLGDLPTGLYILQWTTTEGKQYSKKIVRSF
ncbi:MAG: T9SS type A sorting domain-containing protein [Saprospiraceae bacterium]